MLEMDDILSLQKSAEQGDVHVQSKRCNISLQRIWKVEMMNMRKCCLCNVRKMPVGIKKS